MLLLEVKHTRLEIDEPDSWKKRSEIKFLYNPDQILRVISPIKNGQ